MRDRLIELLYKAEGTVNNDVPTVEQIADYLLGHGVSAKEVGRWIEQSDGWDGVLYTCSVCRCDWCTIDGTPLENNMRYCPGCGAKMNGLAERRANDE